MKLTGLIPLHRSMREQGMRRVKFRYEVNRLTFECLFFIDGDPYELVMGCLGRNFAIFKEVWRGFEINPFLGDLYGPLQDALHLGAGTNIRLDPKVFFAEFNARIPSQARPEDRPSTVDIARYYPIKEEADKLYFCGWTDHGDSGRRVTEHNLEKTLRLMGRPERDFSLRRNQSTRWTDDQTKAKEFFIPG